MNNAPQPAAAEETPPPGRRERSRLWWGARIWLAGAAGFLLLAVFASFYDRFPGDERIAHALQDIDVPLFAGFVDFINILGDRWGSVGLTLAAAVAFAVTRRGTEALIVLSTVGVRFFNTVVKDLVERPRPSADLVDVRDVADGFSFASGHTVGTAALFAVLFLLIPKAVPRRPLRWTLQAACLLALVSAGPARVYVGVHWPSDVFGSYLLVLLFLVPVLAAYLALGRRGRST